ncbi:hypothetical protein GS624_19070 [Ruegeria sp. HKCCD5849]|nr:MULTISPECIES: class II aldolase/adducin family protein [unclassified Ruegeria]NOD49421.1 hypothetical protein [Ruegeria sp. HKCCD5849]NOD53734.1 hypothetical protein [Ruegeria sp. HKCCD5851]
MSDVIRQDLAALYRLAHYYGWTDLTSTHISARLPEDPDHYLLNSHDLMFDEITASNLTRMSFDGQAVDDGPGSGKIVNLAGHIIHSGILSARPDVNYVIHSHTRWRCRVGHARRVVRFVPTRGICTGYVVEPSLSGLHSG